MTEVVGERFNEMPTPAPQQARERYTIDDLCEAVRKKEVEKVRSILDTKEVADINAYDKHGWTPLRQAVCESSVECAWLLLAAGANVNQKSREYDEETPLAYAVLHYRASAPLVKLLLQYKADPNIAIRDDEKLPILQAAKQGKETLLKLLLDAGADAEGTDRNGKTAAHYAAEAGHAGILRILAAHGADLDKAAGHYKYTPLAEAITSHNREAFDVLLECGASLMVHHEKGHTLLMYAAWAGEAGIVEELARRGLPLDAQTNEGYTALMWAAEEGKLYMAEKLLELGASPLLRNKNGLSAANIAREKGHDDLAALLDTRKLIYSAGKGQSRAAKPFRITLGAKNGQ
jgi:ankyrin repeat protein